MDWNEIMGIGRDKTFWFIEPYRPLAVEFADTVAYEKALQHPLNWPEIRLTKAVQVDSEMPAIVTSTWVAKAEIVRNSLARYGATLNYEMEAGKLAGEIPAVVAAEILTEAELVEPMRSWKEVLPSIPLQ
ncbi:hypothetical protein ACINK0_11430 [Deinococcus sp. VB343]|uniref:hypothetical protein n=1 Tax=Deinococcus sp. VB343 TaxID=3385567 RepID=UPI0039C93134